MNRKKIFFLILNVFIFLGIIFFILQQGESKIQDNNCNYTYIEKVYDGDTIFGKNVGKIRILGVDTPEIYHKGWTKIKNYKFYACGEYGQKLAQQYLLHKKIKYCFDKNEDKTGGYGRILAYIYFIGENNKLTDFGQLLVQLGYASVYKAANFKKKSTYLKLEKQAKKEKKGIWSTECIEKDKKFKKLFNK